MTLLFRWPNSLCHDSFRDDSLDSLGCRNDQIEKQSINTSACYRILASAAFSSLLLVYSLSSSAAPPAAPILQSSTNGTTLTIEWTAVAGASGYTLFYSSYPNEETVGSLNMGTALSVSGELPIGSSYYLVVQAYNNEGVSEFSNIENFSINSVDIIVSNNLNTQMALIAYGSRNNNLIARARTGKIEELILTFSNGKQATIEAYRNKNAPAKFSFFDSEISYGYSSNTQSWFGGISTSDKNIRVNRITALDVNEVITFDDSWFQLEESAQRILEEIYLLIQFPMEDVSCPSWLPQTLCEGAEYELALRESVELFEILIAAPRRVVRTIQNRIICYSANCYKTLTQSGQEILSLQNEIERENDTELIGDWNLPGSGGIWISGEGFGCIQGPNPEGCYNNSGNRDGVWKTYNQGELSAYATYRNGVLHGFFSNYFSREAEGLRDAVYPNPILIGIAMQGSLGYYEEGIRVGVWSYYIGGRLDEKAEWIDGERYAYGSDTDPELLELSNKCVTAEDNNYITTAGCYDSYGRKEGTWFTWRLIDGHDVNGLPGLTQTFTDGVLHGYYSYYANPDDNNYGVEGQYVRGNRDGAWTYRSSGGTVTDYYENGVRTDSGGSSGETDGYNGGIALPRIHTFSCNLQTGSAMAAAEAQYLLYVNAVAQANAGTATIAQANLAYANYEIADNLAHTFFTRIGCG